MKKDHIHTPHDGRALRDVFVDDKLVKGVFFADTKRGIVRAYKYPLRLDKWRKRVLSETLHGVVEVRAKVVADGAPGCQAALVDMHTRNERPLLRYVGGGNKNPVLSALLALPDADLMTATKIDDPLGAGTYYRADTVARLLQEARDDERRKCADACDDVAEDCNNWDEGGDDGKNGAMLCAARIRVA